MQTLTMWTIYRDPDDYPGQYVARRWEARETPVATGDLHLADSLEAIRALIPPGLARLPRYDGDDPCIVETWF